MDYIVFGVWLLDYGGPLRNTRTHMNNVLQRYNKKNIHHNS